ncbi:MAG: 3'-5' exonuclease [Bacteroidales bacterium]
MFVAKITKDEIANLPRCSFSGELIVADTMLSFVRAMKCLENESILGYDTETRPSFTKGVRYGVSLLQLSTANYACLFRVDKIGLPKELVRLLENEKIFKIGAAVHDDVRGLQQIENFNPAGFVDLQTLAPKFGIEDKSLKKMAAIILGVRISKSQQTSNWANSVYSSEQKLYAATDAWICREMLLCLQTKKMADIIFEKLEKLPKIRKKRSTPSMMRTAQKKVSDFSTKTI